jgi:DNA mismatch repair protein MutL
VNVHPAKREVRFHRPFELRDLIAQAVSECLRPKPVVRAEPVSSAEKALSPMVARPVFHQVQPELVAAETKIPAKRRSPDFRIIGMLQERYVIMESTDGLVLFDPRAARERIIFEQLSKGRKAGMETQSLLVPLLLELDPRDLDLLLRERMALMDAGIEVEAFGGNTLQVRSVPQCLAMQDAHALLDEMITELLHGPTATGRFAFERLTKVIANKAGLRVMPRLTETEALLEELFQCDLPYCAADGRPTLTEYNRKDIDRRFGIGRG